MIWPSYNLSEKELLEVRKNVFANIGIPILLNNGFEPSPFSTAWYGKNSLGDYTFEFCRISQNSILELVVTHISRGDKWIKIFLNIFQLEPKITTLKKIKGVDGLQYHLPPNSLTKMRLDTDFDNGFNFPNPKEYKLKNYCSRNGFLKRVDQLGVNIENDLTNIDYFIENWHKYHKMNFTDWEGKRIS